MRQVASATKLAAPVDQLTNGEPAVPADGETEAGRYQIMLDRLGREIRLQRGGKSLRALADECGLSHEVLWRIEHGKTNPRLRTLFVISEALNSDMANLLWGQPLADDGLLGSGVSLPGFTEPDLQKLDVQASELVERWLLRVFEDPDKLSQLRDALRSLLFGEHLKGALRHAKAQRGQPSRSQPKTAG